MKSIGEQISEMEAVICAAKGRPYLGELKEREALKLGLKGMAELNNLQILGILAVEIGRIEGAASAGNAASAVAVPGSVQSQARIRFVPAAAVAPDPAKAMADREAALKRAAQERESAARQQLAADREAGRKTLARLIGDRPGTISRAEFEMLTPKEAGEFFRLGGKIDGNLANQKS